MTLLNFIMSIMAKSLKVLKCTSPKRVLWGTPFVTGLHVETDPWTTTL